MEKTIFEQMGGTYTQQGDCYLPNLVLPTEKETRPIGVWGQRHLRYLKECHRITYANLLTSGKLNSYLVDIDERAENVSSVGKADGRARGCDRAAKGGKSNGVGWTDK